MNEVIKNIDIYYNIYENINANINNKNRNYEILFNIDYINKKNIPDDIKNIINENDINIQFKNIMNIYRLMKGENINQQQQREKHKDEIIIKYKINKEDKQISIFGKKFVGNNKEICKYIYNNKEYELIDKFDLKYFDKSKDILEIKLIGLQNVTDMSYLFYDCISLIDISGLSDLNTSRITDMGLIFFNCKMLNTIPDISNWDTSNAINMQEMFGSCKSLKSLPDISK